jgi:hypothetical protein
MTDQPRRRWFRFGLRTLFVVVTLLCCYLAWETSVVRQRRAMLQELRAKGGVQIVTAQMAQPSPVTPRAARIPLVRRVLGDEAIQEIWLSWYPAVSAEERDRMAKVFPEATFHEVLPEPCHPGCFPGGTLVETLSGLRQIETIQPGDFITTMDGDGDATSTQVESVFVTDNRLWQVNTDAECLVTTQTQPLYVGDGKVLQVGDLHPGDTIFRWQGGIAQPAKVVAVSSTGRVEKVYNLILGNSEVFVAGGFLARSKPPSE